MNKLFVVEVEGYEGEHSAIRVENDDSSDQSPKIYCIGELGDDGIVRFIDWGYTTLASARSAIGETVVDVVVR